MKNKILIALMLGVMLCLVSCFFKKEHKDVDVFYTTNHFGQFHVLPLAKPIIFMYDPKTKEWWIDTKNALNHNMSNVITEKEIGIENTYIYGKLRGWTDTIESYTPKDYVFLNKYGTIYGPTKSRKGITNEIQIYPTDSIHKIFIIPERWYVINVADSTIEGFFSKKEYENYLKEKGVFGKMYSIEKAKKEFMETGIAPWFPEDVKTKLRE